MAKLLTAHLEAIGESYGEHFVAASGFGLRMVTTGFACLIHGFLPFLFERTGSEMVRRLHSEMVVKRRAAVHHDWII